MGKYVTPTEVQQEGGSGNAAVVSRRILKWETIVERVTRSFFVVTEPGELTFDGNNARLLHFSSPLVEVTSVKINGEDTALDPAEYRAATGIALPQDDRQNPKLALTCINRDSIFRKTHAIFVKGMDQKVTAKWGYVDPDPDNPGQYITPPPIKDAILKLVVLDLDGYFIQGTSAGRALSPLRRERTDDHEVEYMEIEDVRVTYSMIPRDVYDVLMLYRAPMAIAAPDPRDFYSITDANLVLAF